MTLVRNMRRLVSLDPEAGSHVREDAANKQTRETFQKSLKRC